MGVAGDVDKLGICSLSLKYTLTFTHTLTPVTNAQEFVSRVQCCQCLVDQVKLEILFLQATVEL
jgi:hypothetical protein